MKLKILNQNCFDSPFSTTSNKKFNAMAEQILKLDPDIVLLQELVKQSSVDILQSGLKGYKFYRGNRRAGGLMIASKIPVQNYKFVKYNRQASLDPLSWLDKWLGKGFQVLDLKISSKKITLLNTHLLPNYLGFSGDRKVIDFQVRQLVSFINKIKGIVLLGGDFNFGPDSEFYDFCIKEAGIEDPLDGSKVNTFDPKFLPALYRPFVHKASKYDFLFYKGELRVKQSVVLDKPVSYEGKKFYLSDHKGLLTKVNF